LWNFESHRAGLRATDYTDEDYLPAPIGDAITTELAARLPYEVRARLAPSSLLSDDEKDEIYRRLQRIEDVRPLFAALHWVYQEVARLHAVYGDEKARAVHVAVEDAVRSMVEEFRKLEFFREWFERHHRVLHFDAAKQLSTLLDTLTLARVDTIASV